MSDTRAAILAADEAFMDAFVRREALKIAALYTDEGQLFPTHSDVITGRDAIAGYWNAAMDMGIASIGLETVELDELGDTAVETGRYTLAAADGEILDRGKYLVVWKDEGGCKLHRDIWNSSEA